MLIEGQKIELKWSVINKEWYENKGYTFSDYGEKFIIDAKDLTKGQNIKVKLKCDYCGKIYETAFRNYYLTMNSNNKKCCCYNCRRQKQLETTFLDRQQNLYDKAIIACNKKGYKLSSDKKDIMCNTTYVKYICPNHGIQQMRISNLINGRGCPKCQVDNNAERYKLNIEEVCKRIEDCGGELLNKDSYINNRTKNLMITCPICNKPFKTSLAHFVQHGGQCCGECSDRESLGEKHIRKYLEENSIDFKQEFWFKDCRDVKPLPFDFYLPKYNLCIEFDGRQHFEETNHFGHGVEHQKKHDEIKNQYCKENNIDLLRISYKQISKINEILKNKLFT